MAFLRRLFTTMAHSRDLPSGCGPAFPGLHLGIRFSSPAGIAFYGDDAYNVLKQKQ
jgi:hypothetical protein